MKTSSMVAIELAMAYVNHAEDVLGEIQDSSVDQLLLLHSEQAIRNVHDRLKEYLVKSNLLPKKETECHEASPSMSSPTAPPVSQLP